MHYSVARASKLVSSMYKNSRVRERGQIRMSILVKGRVRVTYLGSKVASGGRYSKLEWLTPPMTIPIIKDYWV